MTTFLSVLLAASTIFHVDPWSNKIFLPSADPAGGVKTSEISFVAAKGEFESISFIVNPDQDYKKVDVRVSELKSAGGGVIPSSAVDVMLVKVWFRPGGRWLHSWAGNQACPTPINNLVIHDDALIKVDWVNKINYLRGDFEDGPYYMDMSHRELKTHFNNDTQPIHDAPKFVPFDLKKDFRQQYLVTWRIPGDAKPGNYTGKIALVDEKGASLGTIKLALEVYPFVLPSPRTHYDTSKRYYSFWMGSPSFGRLMTEGYRMDRAERKMRAIYRNMAEHGAVNLSDVGDLAVDDPNDPALRTLIIARQEGMCANPIINGPAWDAADGKFVCIPGGKRTDLIDPEDYPERYTNSLVRFTKGVDAQIAIMRKYLGHANFYRSNPDECSAFTYRRAMGYWRIVHDRGGLIWNDYAFPYEGGWLTDVNDVPASFDHQLAWEWHRGGAKCFTYAGTFTGPECPDLWRRNKGIRYWYSDYDGQHEYCFFDGRSNRWNDFVHYERYCQFGIVYWTDEGMVSTLAWEANREGLDDVRYFSLLRMRAEAALKSSDPAIRKLGREAIIWQDGIDPEYEPDLDSLRRRTAEWIKRLMAKIGPEPDEKPLELPPPKLAPDGAWAMIPPKGTDAQEVMKFVDKCSRGQLFKVATFPRLDVAVVALENVWADPKMKVSERVSAGLRAVGYYCRMQERTTALKILDTLLALKGLSIKERSILRLTRTQTMLTDVKFEERYTAAQLDAAADAAQEALKGQGASTDRRSETVAFLTRAYLSAKEYQKCIDYGMARIKDVTLSRYGKTKVHFLMAQAYMYLEDWTNALKQFDEAHRTFNNDKDVHFRREVFPFEANAAEKAKDYMRAVHCLTELIPTYDPGEEKQYIIETKNRIKKLQPLARKNMKINMGSLDDDDTRDELELDE